MSEALSFLTVESGLKLSLEKAKYIFGMSEMTVINENPSEEHMIYHTWGNGTI